MGQPWVVGAIPGRGCGRAERRGDLLMLHYVSGWANSDDIDELLSCRSVVRFNGRLAARSRSRSGACWSNRWADFWTEMAHTTVHMSQIYCRFWARPNDYVCMA